MTTSHIASDAADTGRPSRLVGIDAARGLALIGMLMVHFGPEDGEGLAGLLYGAPHGRASILFAVVAGIGIAMIADGRAGLMAARMRLLCYAAVLLPLGLALQALDHPVSVIIHHYAAFFVLGAVVVGLSRGTILAIAVVTTVLGPTVYLAGQASWPEMFDRNSVELGQGLHQIVTGLLVSGPYPLLTWAAPILWGIWLGRLDLRSGKVQTTLVGGGIAVAMLALAVSLAGQAALGVSGEAAEWRDLLSSVAHSQMPLWIVQAVAIAGAIVGLCLMLARFLPKVVEPLAVLGSMTLSVYVAHLLALAAFDGLMRWDTVAPGAITTLVFVTLATVFAYVWRPLGRGPIERAMHEVWLVVARGARIDNGAPVVPVARS